MWNFRVVVYLPYRYRNFLVKSEKLKISCLSHCSSFHGLMSFDPLMSEIYLHVAFAQLVTYVPYHVSTHFNGTVIFN
jgi:hypothetical protein